MKIKALMPSLREKKRYLAFEVMTDGHLTASEVEQAVNKGLQRYLGVLGQAKAGARFMKDRYDPAERRGLIRVSHTMTGPVTAGLSLITEAGNAKASIMTVGASGILKKAQQYVKREV